MSDVRVRFAPSPTGFFHIGSARTALFNWLYARHTGGTFVLRIEDTDKERNTDEALRVLLEGMRWMGMDWDEGPEVGGAYGPYFQSERQSVYDEYLKKLVDAGRTYEKDGAIWFKLEGERYTEYDDFKEKEIEKVKAAPVIIDDAVRGRVERAEELDFVIVRKDGNPVFHFVNVVDDIAMGITHVIRGEDHLSNTSKHVELFNAFGVKPPVFAHIPLILKEVGSGKMSKRDKGALIEEYADRGFLANAVRNYISLLGWNPKDEREKMDIDDIIELFDFPGINKGNSRFDEKKLSALNTEYLRELNVESYAFLARPMLHTAGVITEDVDEDYLQSVLTLCQGKARGLDDLADFCRYFFVEDFELNEKVGAKIAKKADPKELLAEILPVIEGVETFDADSLQAALEAHAESKEVKVFAYFPALRYALSGQGGGPDLLPMLAVLGKDRVIARLKAFIG
ncbi:MULTISPECIES: glutamate--tRNA ligase [unclassified Lentimonas]|uniref:glutamate--tRNA ligase n=1 Tax=unclassified Lentimonas TaxID=2630993 RepID=UPI0013262D7C|nr:MULTISPECIES: glutamate--tRNA ligase family protein [unclassified Lentimonas]CAA6679728.1 Glutamyl-tRNA synthetase (EC @ Glutamyl-tRNA(Gln) synthetase (EC [Lentimonas sp. CC4]CAA6683506.1 Glutamyl-tRNA synthetase (EC @ Glutamyl-tRNA(Gln) synthetase (EC [Lentimonas sp. CC6]CAA6693227.1 Glutamyl-tRNA synthetase (EC @ Glutamyl-tRNA(Gln) synthetase (EC [Lentimonas sp. CC10]CAA6695485.1 Glutamyl-tRNA synthetase (EC @ Glutamyl-tRNA(Gln) synthetase (EC [Lentimonas sp. CC19]CAA7071748.1 Glutamyl-tR